MALAILGRAAIAANKYRKARKALKGKLATKAVKPTPKSGKGAVAPKPKGKVKAGTVAGAAVGGGSMGYAKYNSDKKKKKKVEATPPKNKKKKDAVSDKEKAVTPYQKKRMLQIRKEAREAKRSKKF